MIIELLLLLLLLPSSSLLHELHFLSYASQLQNPEKKRPLHDVCSWKCTVYLNPESMFVAGMAPHR